MFTYFRDSTLDEEAKPTSSLAYRGNVLHLSLRAPEAPLSACNPRAHHPELAAEPLGAVRCGSNAHFAYMWVDVTEADQRISA